MAKRPDQLDFRRPERKLSERTISLGPSKQSAASRRLAGQLFSLADTGQDILDQVAVDEATLAGTLAGRDVDGFRPRRDHTLSARAFNQAGLRSFQSELEIRATEEQSRLYELHKNDPAKLQDALNGYRLGMETQLQEQVPEAVDDFRGMYKRAESAYMRKASDEYLRVQESQAAATSNEFLGNLQERAENIAFDTRSDVEAANAIADERDRLIDELVQYGPKQGFEIQGREVEPDIDRLEVYTPEQMQKVVDAYDAQMISKRILGKFERAASKENFLGRFEAKLGKADLVQGLTIDQTNTLRATMRAGVRAERADRAAASSALRGDVKDALTLLKKGRTPRDLDKLRNDVAGLPELAGPLEQGIALAGYAKTLRGSTPDQLDEELERYRDNPPDNLFDQAAFEVVESTRNEMMGALEKDWLAWGDASGDPKLQLNELDLADPASLKERDAIVAKYERKFGRQGPVLTDEEADELANAWASADGGARLGMTQRLTENLDGERASRTFELLDKKHARELAMMGETLNEGAVTTATLISRGMDQIRDDPKIIPTGSGNDLQANLRLQLAGQYDDFPAHRALVLDTAVNIYAGLAASNGVMDGTLDMNLAETALQEATGGMVEYNPRGFAGARKIIAPARGVTSEQFQGFIDTLDGNDINRWGGVMGFTHNAVVERIQTGKWRLVPLERGRYGVLAETLADDRLGQQFRPVKRRDGNAFVIDYNDREEKFDAFSLQ